MDVLSQRHGLYCSWLGSGQQWALLGPDEIVPYLPRGGFWFFLTGAATAVSHSHTPHTPPEPCQQTQYSGAAKSLLTCKASGIKLTNETLNVMGVEGTGITVPLLGNTKLRPGDKMITGQLLCVSKAETNLLGRDLMIKLGIQIVNC